MVGNQRFTWFYTGFSQVLGGFEQAFAWMLHGVMLLLGSFRWV